MQNASSFNKLYVINIAANTANDFNEAAYIMSNTPISNLFYKYFHSKNSNKYFIFLKILLDFVKK